MHHEEEYVPPLGQPEERHAEQRPLVEPERLLLFRRDPPVQRLVLGPGGRSGGNADLGEVRGHRRGDELDGDAGLRHHPARQSGMTAYQLPQRPRQA
nr:hypothetical protein [Streptomyces sp. Wb2n-11]